MPSHSYTAYRYLNSPTTLWEDTLLLGPDGSVEQSDILLRGSDMHLARLPYSVAEFALEYNTQVDDPAIFANVGWHGTSIDGERGMFAIVKKDGPLVALVGERIRLNSFVFGHPPRSVSVYVHRDGDIIEDLSVTRRTFLGLGNLASDSLTATVEVLV